MKRKKQLYAQALCWGCRETELLEVADLSDAVFLYALYAGEC